jgi:hypothetical protein
LGRPNPQGGKTADEKKSLLVGGVSRGDISLFREAQ